MMRGQSNQADWPYITLLIIWVACLVAQPLFLIPLHDHNPDLFNFDYTKSFIGEHYIAIPLATIFALEELVTSYLRWSWTLGKSILDQNPELVRTALVLALCHGISISLCGIFLAWMFDYTYFYIWVMVGIFVNLFYFPRRSYIEAATYKVN
jgi:hypothetical protein